MVDRLESDQQVHAWQTDVHNLFLDLGVGHIAHVPDGGLKGLIKLCENDPKIGTTTLTTEEEGVGLCAGLHLGGVKSALLMQSSGVGNCVNMFSLMESCRFPLLMLVTMRGEWAEFVPTQIPTGKRVPEILKALDFDIYRVDRSEDVRSEVHAAYDQAYQADRRTAVILSQRLIGRKNWSK